MVDGGGGGDGAMASSTRNVLDVGANLIRYERSGELARQWDQSDSHVLGNSIRTRGGCK